MDAVLFPVFSSVASGRGLAPGISPYGMANSGMERICEARHAMGLPALAIQFGPIGDVGYMFDTFGSEAVIYKRTAQCISSCLTALEKFMTQSYTVVASHVIPDKQHQNNSTSVTEKEILNVIANVLGKKLTIWLKFKIVIISPA
jgi:fatty acid synthase